MALSLDENAAEIWRFLIMGINRIYTREWIIINYEKHHYSEININ